MWPLKTLLYFLFFWGSCFAALFNPIWGVTNYLIAYQACPPNRWWGIPLRDIGMRFSLLAVIFVIVGLFTGRRRVPEAKPTLTLWEWGVLGLVALALANIVLGVGYGPSARFAFEKFWKLQVFVLILTRLATTRKNLKLVVWTLVAGSAYLGYDAYTSSYHAFLSGRLDTFGGSDFATSSGASAHLIAMLPIIGIAFLIAKQWKWKAMAAISGALTVNAIVLCRTRSAFIGLAVGAVAAVLMAPKAKRFRIHAGLCIGALLAFALTDSHYWERMGTLVDKDALRHDSATVTRTDIFTASLQMLSEHPTGVGLGNFSRVIGTYNKQYRDRSPHNTLVMAFCELGVLGGMLFLALCIGSVRLLFRCSRMAELTEHPIETKVIAYGLLVSLVSYFVAGLGTERFSCESFWWILVFPVCLHRLVMREATARAAAPATELEPSLLHDHIAWGKPQPAV